MQIKFFAFFIGVFLGVLAFHAAGIGGAEGNPLSSTSKDLENLDSEAEVEGSRTEGQVNRKLHFEESEVREGWKAVGGDLERRHDPEYVSELEAGLRELHQKMEQELECLAEEKAEIREIELKTAERRDEQIRLQAQLADHPWVLFQKSSIYGELEESQRDFMKRIFENLQAPLQIWQVQALLEYLPDYQRRFEAWRDRHSEVRERVGQIWPPVAELKAVEAEGERLREEKRNKLLAILLHEELVDRL
ncbi:MAG: hypothetical protein DWQ01_18210 [Planctomycetota bacterium]|nr:MAG: hypothetical protein DWQ01_18210 [Planctomycetota bacterium]